MSEAWRPPSPISAPGSPAARAPPIAAAGLVPDIAPGPSAAIGVAIVAPRPGGPRGRPGPIGRPGVGPPRTARAMSGEPGRTVIAVSAPVTMDPALLAMTSENFAFVGVGLGSLETVTTSGCVG